MCFYIIKYVYSFQRTHIFFLHFVGVFVYAGTINRTPTAADGLPKHCERIAKMLRTDCDNILNKLQQHNIQKTKTILLQCKNPLFARQKPPFYTPKTILLQRKNHTFEWRLCNIQIMNTLRTFCECATNSHETHHETHRKMSHSHTKYPTNTPQGVGADLSCPCPCVIKNVYPFQQIHISTF